MIERMKRLRPRYAPVAATLALVLALGMGGAYAAQKLGSKQIAKSAVKSKHIKDGGVKFRDLAAAAVTDPAIAANAVSRRAIADGSVDGTKLAEDSIHGGNIVNESIKRADLGDDSVGDSELALTLRTTQINVANNETGALTAPCGTTEVAISGGGGFAGAPNGTTLATTEAANGGWYVEGKNTSGAPKTLIAQAFCLAK